MAQGGVSVLISIDIHLTNLYLMTQCAWTVGISHSPQRGAKWVVRLQRKSQETVSCQISQKMFSQLSRARESEEKRRKWLK